MSSVNLKRVRNVQHQRIKDFPLCIDCLSMSDGDVELVKVIKTKLPQGSDFGENNIFQCMFIQSWH